ncbi:MAG: hypothetical protein JWP89_2852 [Schlesneria sp.]|nr:hypothetical protein [Schlesneria sp.]
MAIDASVRSRWIQAMAIAGVVVLAVLLLLPAGAASTRGGSANAVEEQSQADWAGVRQLSRHVSTLASRRDL